ncbi:MAG: RIP metalloprotease RseP [Candidatus Paceibacterota bacterium]
MAISTIIIFLLILGVIVFVHELGHFTMAKLFGVKVEEFGLGFPPKIIGKKKGETEYTLNWIPLGGFVKIAGEDGENRDDPRSFGAKPIWQRAIILSAGVIMNFVLAVVLFSIVFMSGFPTDVSGISQDEIPSDVQVYVQVGELVKDSPAEKSGLMSMDKILKIGDVEVENIEDVQQYSKENPGKEATLVLERQGETIQKEVLIREEYPENEGAMGISLAKTAIIHYSFLGSIKEAVFYTVDLTKFIFSYLLDTVGQLIFTGGTTAQVSGPVGMVSMTAQAAQLGIIVLLNFTALISVNLAIINILPLPALDGGRIIFLVAEKIKGKPVSQEFEAKVHNAGFMFLMLLMVVVTFQDVARLGVWDRIMGMF